MVAEDLPRVHEIENQFQSMPWTVKSFLDELANRDAILKVAIHHGQVIGYICIRSLLDVTHLLKITVLPAFRRRGIGRALFQNALETLREARPDTHELTLEVRESNSAAIYFYKEAGFHETGRRPGYFRRPDEDALIMGLDLS